MYEAGTIADFKRALLRLATATVVLSVVVGHLWWNTVHGDTTHPPWQGPTQALFNAQQTRLLQDFSRWSQQYQWTENRQAHARILGASRRHTGIARLEYQLYPDRYLWLLDDTPDSFHNDGMEISMRLDHGQQFLDWLDTLRQNALAFPLNCRLWRASDNITPKPAPEPVQILEPGRASKPEQTPKPEQTSKSEQASNAHTQTKPTPLPIDLAPAITPERQPETTASIQAECNLVWLSADHIQY